MKRVFDIVCSMIILLCFLPFGLIIALLIVLESRGGVFYRQTRVGRFGKPFKLWKFRTMRPNSDKLGTLTVGMRDPRITRVGCFIRKTKMDEFPQFLNVLVGDMSIVGPRPEVKEFVDLYTAEQQKILRAKPGITDYASLEYFKENELLGKAVDPRKTYIEEIMPAKIELNMKYLNNQGFAQDVLIMWQTFLKIIS
jgi:lipopolysaccharide/colanic/teichoic acid biosynthesis glycosyltransferase